MVDMQKSSTGPNKMAAPSLSVILPVYNEAEAISRVVDRLSHELESSRGPWTWSSYQIIAVDDGSTDGSKELLTNDSRLTVLETGGRKGYGAALKIGFAHAQSDLIAFLDMDQTYDPRDLTKLVRAQAASDADLVCGSRLNTLNGMPAVRMLGNHFFTALTRLFFATSVTDVATGYRVFPRRMTGAALQIPADDLSFAFAFTLTALKKRCRMVEVPIAYHERLGASKLSVVNDGARFLKLVISSYMGN